MKNKGLIILPTIIFLAIINTTYFWEAKIGLLAIPITLVLIVAYFVLIGLLLGQLFFSIKERFTKKQRLFVIALLVTTVTLTTLEPHGLINFENLEGKDLLIAEREGVANCMTTFKLKENNKFTERNVCFGITVTKGDYKIKGDTIFFSNVELGRDERGYYEFAVIKLVERKSENKIGDLIRYKNQSDSIGQKIWIVKNDLTENKN